MPKHINITNGIIAAAVVTAFGFLLLISPAATQYRAELSMEKFLVGSTMKFSLKRCVSDSDSDGYASCSVIGDNIPVSLQCNSSIISIAPLVGSQSCKIQENSVIKLK